MFTQNDRKLTKKNNQLDYTQDLREISNNVSLNRVFSKYYTINTITLVYRSCFPQASINLKGSTAWTYKNKQSILNCVIAECTYN